MTDSVPAPMVLPRTPGSVVEATHRDQRGLWMLTPLRDWVMSDINNTAVLAATEGLTVHRVLFDAATPAASVPAADILALADHEKSLRELWREAAEKRIEQGVDWPRIVLTLFADIDRAVHQADLWQDKAEIADHERQDWKRWCKEAGALRAAMEAERDALAALVAAAEQADKGEAADTPRDEYDAHLGTTIAPAAPPEPVCVPRVARSLSDLKPGQVVALTRRSIDRRRIGTIRSVGNGGAMLQLEGDDLRSQSAFSFDVGEWVILEDTTPAAEQADKGEADDV